MKKRVLVKCLNKKCKGKKVIYGTQVSEWNYQSRAWFQVLYKVFSTTTREWCPKCKVFRYLWADTDD